MAYSGQLNMNGSNTACFQAGGLKATMSFLSELRLSDAASSVVSQDEEDRKQRESQPMTDMSVDES